MQISYAEYLNKVLGGWIGKSAGGAIGARFEGNKSFIDIAPEEMFPEVMPPNDDLDLQVLWLKVLEEKGAAITSDDMAKAWLEACWYPFNEYGTFRRNWRLGIHAPMSGRFTNQFWETGMGCPIRSEIWGYVFPGAPDLAARYAYIDGTLDHTKQSVGAEMMFAAMASMVFFISDLRRLAEMFIHYLPKGSPVDRMTREVFHCYDRGLSLPETRERIMMLAGHPEACDCQTNVPWTFVGLLYGDNDMRKTLLSALKCGYDTDCTLATAGAFVGQILGATGLPQSIKEPVGDELVMGIEYNRPEMTLTALARDTARMGVLLAQECQTSIEIVDAPEVAPLPATAVAPATRLSVEYVGLPEAAPGDVVDIVVRVEGTIPQGAGLTITGPEGWTVVPERAKVGPLRREVRVSLCAPEAPELWPQKNLFTARLGEVEYVFGVAGAQLWKLLGIYYDSVPGSYVDESKARRRRWQHHFVSLQKEYLPEPIVDVERLFERWSEKLGKPAVVAAYERVVDPRSIVGLRGQWIAYLARTVISPHKQRVHIIVGNSDGYRLWVNSKLVGEEDERVCWAPFNSVHEWVTLREGANEIVLKLVKPGDDFKLTFGIRDSKGPRGGIFATSDWIVNLADVVP